MSSCSMGDVSQFVKILMKSYFKTWASIDFGDLSIRGVDHLNKNISVGLIQLQSSMGDISKNVERAVKYIEMASDKGADIVCFPELFITGYNMDLKELFSTESINEVYDYAIEKLTVIASEKKMHLIVPIAYTSGGKKINGAIFIDDDGKIIGRYGKTHLYNKERNNFERGDSIDVFDTKLGKIGIMICYDAGFPEVCRIMALKDAEIVFCPSAWRIEDKRIWDLNLAQRALENNIFVIGVNAFADESFHHLFGNSKIVNPIGEVVAEIGEDIEDIIVETIDLSSIKEYKKDVDYKNDRNSALYSKIASKSD
jgi:predicted amidohydrolase